MVSLGTQPANRKSGFGHSSPTGARAQDLSRQRARRDGVAVESAGDVVVIGDTPLDVQCAVAAGARSVAVATGSYNEAALRDTGAHVVLADLRDTDAVIELLLSVSET